MAGWYDNPAIVGLIIAAPASILGFLGWWRSRGMDEAAKVVAVEAERTTRGAEAREDLESIIDNLQADNKVLRDHQTRMEQRIEAIQERLDEIRAENRALRLENEKMERRIAEIENGRK